MARKHPKRKRRSPKPQLPKRGPGRPRIPPLVYWLRELDEIEERIHRLKHEPNLHGEKWRAGMLRWWRERYVQRYLAGPDPEV